MPDKRWSVPLFFLFFTATVFAAVGSGSELAGIQETFNNRTADLPGWIGTLIGDQRINVYLIADDDWQNFTVGQNVTPKEELGIEMEGKHMDTIQTSALDKPTIEIWTHGSTIEGLASSDAPVQDIKEAVKERDIRYRVSGFFNRIRFGIVRNSVNIASSMGLL